MSGDQRPSAADWAVVHLTIWWIVAPLPMTKDQLTRDEMMCAVLAEVLAGANRALPLIAEFAAIADQAVALGPHRAGGCGDVLRLQNQARPLVAMFHACRGGEALEVYRKGKTDA